MVYINGLVSCLLWRYSRINHHRCYLRFLRLNKASVRLWWIKRLQQLLSLVDLLLLFKLGDRFVHWDVKLGVRLVLVTAQERLFCADPTILDWPLFGVASIAVSSLVGLQFAQLLSNLILSECESALLVKPVLTFNFINTESGLTLTRCDPDAFIWGDISDLFR